MPVISKVINITIITSNNGRIETQTCSISTSWWKSSPELHVLSCWICCKWVNELWKPLHECLLWMRHHSQSHFHLKALVIHVKHNDGESVRSRRTMTDDKLMQWLSCRFFYFLIFFFCVMCHFMSCLYYFSQYHQLLVFNISLYGLWDHDVMMSLPV